WVPAKRRTTARPMLLLPPVTTATGLSPFPLMPLMPSMPGRLSPAASVVRRRHVARRRVDRDIDHRRQRRATVAPDRIARLGDGVAEGIDRVDPNSMATHAPRDGCEVHRREVARDRPVLHVVADHAQAAVVRYDD